MKNTSRWIALALVVSALGTSSQAFAATKHQSTRGHQAYARAIGEDVGNAGEGGMSAGRDKAIRDCSTDMNKYVQKDWGVSQNTHFADCMTQHGEMP